MFEEINYEVADRIATIELNRPHAMNAMTQLMEQEIQVALKVAEKDEEVHVIMLTAAGENFCSGYDIGAKDPTRPEWMGPIDPLGSSIEDYLTLWYRWDRDIVGNLMSIWRLEKPVISVVQGYVLGGGFWYQLACDLTIAADNAVFGQPEVRHVSNTTFLFPLLAGWKRASRFALTGDPFDAAEAYRMGLVSEVVPRDELIDRSWALASRLAMIPQASLRINKAITMAGLEASGVGAAMQINGILSGLAHSLHGPDREELLQAQRAGGLRKFIKARDGRFQPEPFGPKSSNRAEDGGVR
jgi:enoyl-CoA hydratase/carnithine racemase